jgi:hypothetical protein
MHKPSWFSDGTVMISTAHTCGLTKGGRNLPLIDRATGSRVQVLDSDTGELVDAIDDQLLADMVALRDGSVTGTLQHVSSHKVDLRAAVPVYYDQQYLRQFTAAMKGSEFAGFTSATLGELLDTGFIEIRGGHGSPSHDQRIGEVPYIKVSDLRAGLVNINPTNRVPVSVARKFWGGDSSGLKAFDLLCPERTSKNIGDFCVLMPGQENVVATKEIIVLRSTSAAPFDVFYLLWAMTLTIVRNQWKRIVFMQTNREDVGRRYLEIRIPLPPSRDKADKVSDPFRNYFQLLAKARISFGDYLASSQAHHFFVAGAEEFAREEGAAETD